MSPEKAYQTFDEFSIPNFFYSPAKNKRDQNGMTCVCKPPDKFISRLFLEL